MKTTVLISIALALLAVLIPAAVYMDTPVKEPPDTPPAADAQTGPDSASAETEPENGDERLTAEGPGDEKTGGAADISLRVKTEDGVKTMKLEEYLVGVVAAEMPAYFEPEALKAQAVAARTYSLYKVCVSPSSNHPEADVCTDSACCKAYADEEKLREKWGDEYEKNLQKIEDAVSSTAGEYITYMDQPALAVFHSSSGGATEDSGSVWGESLPYLVSVESPEDGDNIKNFYSTVELSADEFREIFMSRFPEAELDGDPEEWVTDVEYTESGRVEEITVGGVTVPGTEMRSMFTLRSAMFTLETGEDGAVFSVTGYGHGVGMSQYGANELAAEGKTYREILEWYYTGTGFAYTSDLTA